LALATLVSAFPVVGEKETSSALDSAIKHMSGDFPKVLDGTITERAFTRLKGMENHLQQSGTESGGYEY